MWYIILIIFFTHWFLSLFFHTTFLHRYASHKMFEVKGQGEKVLHFLTWFFQGSSYLVPRAYAVMHRMHHEFSDTKEDPHSPHFFKDIIQMMIHTKNIYNGFVSGKLTAASQFCNDLPVWSKFEKFADHWVTRFTWGTAYSIAYFLLIYFLDLSWVWFLLLPIHYLMGPVQGAIVNWCGHKYGYQNFNNGDHSHNSEPFGIILMGELFQNNHHKFPESVNFAQKWFELDPTYYVLKVLDWFKIIRLKK